MISLSGRSLKFLSTPSARRATKNLGRAIVRQFISIHALREEGDYGCALPEDLEKISIHALREEGDKILVEFIGNMEYFYPRPPRGGRRPVGDTLPVVPSISIHALREEGDLSAARLAAKREKFLSTPSARRATFPILIAPSFFLHFYPRPPRGGRRQQ